MSAVRYADNLAELVRRGGSVASDSKLLLVRCVDCSAQYLYDERYERLFLRPDDPTSVFDEDGEPPPCRECGRADWHFEDVAANEEDARPPGPWGWAFWAPPRPRVRPLAVRVLIFIVLVLIAVVGAVSLAINPDPLASPADTPKEDIHDL